MQSTAQLVEKFRNTHFEAKIFRKITVWGWKENYVSLLMTKTAIHIVKSQNSCFCDQNCDFLHEITYRVFHDTGHPEIWLSAWPFINMNWTPGKFLSAWFHKGPGT